MFLSAFIGHRSFIQGIKCNLENISTLDLEEEEEEEEDMYLQILI